jgi:hypothetical protein
LKPQWLGNDSASIANESSFKLPPNHPKHRDEAMTPMRVVQRAASANQPLADLKPMWRLKQNGYEWIWIRSIDSNRPSEPVQRGNWFMEGLYHKSSQVTRRLKNDRVRMKTTHWPNALIAKIDQMAKFGTCYWSNFWPWKGNCAKNCPL